MITIKVLDSVWAETNDEGFEVLNNLLSYKSVTWIKIGNRNERMETKQYIIDVYGDGKYLFPVGFLNKVEKNLRKWGEKYKIIDNLPDVELYDPQIEGYVFRPKQLELITKAVDYGRGYILSPTGTGKSIMLLGIKSCFPKNNILFLVHTADLKKQMIKHLKKAFPGESITDFSSKVNREDFGHFVCSTRKAWAKFAREYGDWPEVIVIDEAHHVTSYTGEYGKILSYSTAHTKLGVTATDNITEEQMAALEGLLGPKLAEYTWEDAIADGVIMKPTIEIHKNNWDIDHAFAGVQQGEYDDIYAIGITYNNFRNTKIVNIVKEMLKEGRSLFITITSIAHGEELQTIAKSMGLDIPFIYGEVKGKQRDKAIDDFKSGKVKAAICSVIFFEGIDIPNLDGLVNAAGGKSIIQVVQRVGRTVRMEENKLTPKIIDFDDSFHPTFKRQSKNRIKVYKSKPFTMKYID